MFEYPTSDLDQIEKLVDLTGSYWATSYQGVDQIQTLLRGFAEASQQTRLNLEELVNSMSRLTLPVFHRERSYLLRIRQNDVNSPQTSVKRYGSGIVYGPDPITRVEYSYGEAYSRRTYAYPVPSNLRQVAVISNRIQDPSVTLIQGIDFELDAENSAVVFQEDPFLNPLFPIQPNLEGNELVDKSIDLWLFLAEFDHDQIYRHLGYILNLKLPSNQAYKDLANAVMDAIVQGTSLSHIEAAIASVLGIPLTKTDSEIVELIETEPDVLQIVTDQNVYTFDAEATAIVEVGETLLAGQSLTDDFVLHQPRRGETPDIHGLTLDGSFLAGNYYGPLLFSNRTETVTVDVDHPSGYTYISWPLTGHPLDVEAFWDDVHTRGVAAGQTLAHLLDTRPEKVGEPGPMALPATINPLTFLCENILRFHTAIAVLKVRDRRPLLQNVTLSQVLRPILPPHMAIILFFALPDVEDRAMMDPDDEIEIMTVMEPLTDTVSMTEDDTISLRAIAGFCN
jgi:hypothetical protein